MSIDRKINEYCKSTGNTTKDVCKAFWAVDIITALVLYTIISIIVIIEVL